MQYNAHPKKKQREGEKDSLAALLGRLAALLGELLQLIWHERRCPISRKIVYVLNPKKHRNM